MVVNNARKKIASKPKTSRHFKAQTASVLPTTNPQLTENPENSPAALDIPGGNSDLPEFKWKRLSFTVTPTATATTVVPGVALSTTITLLNNLFCKQKVCKLPLIQTTCNL